MGNIMAHHKSNLLIGRAKLVEATRKINVTSRRSEGSYLFQPRNLDRQSACGRPICLEAILHPADAVNGPRCVLKSYCLPHLLVQPLAETLPLLKLEIVPHGSIIASNGGTEPRRTDDLGQSATCRQTRGAPRRWLE